MTAERPRNGVLEVFLAFLRLGCTSFGGPVAHLGYYRAELVARRQWLSEAAFADLVALCQFMPGPASSQTGMAIGLLRAGPLGMVAAWVGFTLPSALAMTAFGYGIDAIGDVSHAGWLEELLPKNPLMTPLSPVTSRSVHVWPTPQSESCAHAAN